MGEAYFNFSWSGICISLFAGLAIGKIAGCLDSLNGKKPSLSECYAVVLLPPAILWIRGMFSGIIRPFVWFSILIYFIYRCLYLNRRTVK